LEDYMNAMLRGLCAASLFALLTPVANAQNLILNGGYEAGFANWTVNDQADGSGGWFIQSGTGSPLNGFPVPGQTVGRFAAMSDQGGPGSHVLYQDFVVPVGVTTAILQYDLFLNNSAGAYFTPDTLDFTLGPNQQARVDILTSTSNSFSVAGGDVLQNSYQTQVGDPAVSGYTTITMDVTALLQANAGQTLRLRFAEVDNQLFFNMGVDNVSLNVRADANVPEPGSIALLVGLGTGISLLRKRRK
jgi:hypothetical protein